MKTLSGMRSLSDVRTTISTHGRAAPRREGSTYLEVFLLDKERQRLEAEFAVLAKRQRRIEARLAEIREGIGQLAGATPVEGRAASVAAEMPVDGKGRPWTSLTIPY